MYKYTNLFITHAASYVLKCYHYYAGIEKLKNCFKEYDLPVDQLDKRVTVVCGDLEKERFGLDHSGFCNLGDSLSSIYHLGAHVNHILGYEALRYAVMFVP